MDFYNIESLCTLCDSIPADVVLLIDSSGSIGSSNFYNKVLPFAKNVIDRLDISQEMTHVALAQFSTSVQIIFDLEQSFSKTTLKQKIDQVTYLAEGTYTHSGIQVAMEQIFFKPGRQRRTFKNSETQFVQQILFIVTDG